MSMPKVILARWTERKTSLVAYTTTYFRFRQSKPVEEYVHKATVLEMFEELKLKLDDNVFISEYQAGKNLAFEEAIEKIKEIK